jgi:hypothetical protein
MRSAHLNEHQARHVTTTIALLLEEFSELARSLAAGPPSDATIAQIREVQRQARALLQHLGLSVPERPPLRQRLLAYTGVWLARVHELRAANLVGYGEVSTELAAAVDPRVDDITRALERLTHVAREVSP